MMSLASSRRPSIAWIEERPAARKPKAGSARARLARSGAVRRARPTRRAKARLPEPEMICRPWQAWWEHATYQA